MSLSITSFPEIFSALKNGFLLKTASTLSISSYFETEALNVDESKTPGSVSSSYIITAASGALKFGFANVTGDPQIEGVRMGSLAGKDQESEVSEKINLLKKSQSLVYQKELDLLGADKDKGSFVPPTLFLNEKPFTKTDCHEIEAFGPVATIMPYNDIEEAIELILLGSKNEAWFWVISLKTGKLLKIIGLVAAMASSTGIPKPSYFEAKANKLHSE